MANKGVNRPLAAIYAQALYEAARGVNSQAQVAEELTGIKAMLHKDPSIGIFLESPTISFEDKRKVIENAFKSYSPVTCNFLLVIAERGRSTMLDQIVDAYVDYANKMANIATVEVHSARPLDQDEREKVVAVMKGKLNKSITLSERVNPDLIGGVVLVHEDKMWDGSLRRTLDDAIKTMESIKTNAVKWSE